ncbi:hypothetical protein Hokovirus_1_56 [Hokovirus HKV1]|uniref:Uncharacterized protein n=1 Tax=Hokovirus HKV1 TaxID=1977638 RepID=A0A1V0SEN3_9VIRU|nr:hypothetical protein Hokovirus_1_56 [Hokovirus HKV1]
MIHDKNNKKLELLIIGAQPGDDLVKYLEKQFEVYTLNDNDEINSDHHYCIDLLKLPINHPKKFDLIIVDQSVICHVIYLPSGNIYEQIIKSFLNENGNMISPYCCGGTRTANPYTDMYCNNDCSGILLHCCYNDNCLHYQHWKTCIDDNCKVYLGAKCDSRKKQIDFLINREKFVSDNKDKGYNPDHMEKVKELQEDFERDNVKRFYLEWLYEKENNKKQKEEIKVHIMNQLFNSFRSVEISKKEFFCHGKTKVLELKGYMP